MPAYVSSRFRSKCVRAHLNGLYGPVFAVPRARKIQPKIKTLLISHFKAVLSAFKIYPPNYTRQRAKPLVCHLKSFYGVFWLSVPIQSHKAACFGGQQQPRPGPICSQVRTGTHAQAANKGQPRRGASPCNSRYSRCVIVAG